MSAWRRLGLVLETVNRLVVVLGLLELLVIIFEPPFQFEILIFRGVPILFLTLIIRHLVPGSVSSLSLRRKDDPWVTRFDNRIRARRASLCWRAACDDEATPTESREGDLHSTLPSCDSCDPRSWKAAVLSNPAANFSQIS